jgi:hypothetical protein
LTVSSGRNGRRSLTASIIVQLYEYIRTIFAIVTIGEAATTRVALEKQFGILPASRRYGLLLMSRATADTGIL